MLPRLTSRCFGQLPCGQSVEAWNLRGRGGLELEVITLGARVTRLLAPDRSGRLADVVLGYNDLESYWTDGAYFGAMVGRVAGRISDGRFELEGTTYELSRNDPPNHLHGGVEGFHRRTWTAAPAPRPDGAPSLQLCYESPGGEEGYPGGVRVAVTYTVTDENVFLIETKGTSDRTTILNLTHHSYFNLGGEAAGPVFDHCLQICADEFVPMDEKGTLLGILEPVDACNNDFRNSRALGASIPKLFRSHGDLYRLRASGPAPALAARLMHPPSGRNLEVFTTCSYLQFYTGAALDGRSTGKSGVPYYAHSGVCLECEGYPDAPNAPHLGVITLRPGIPWRETTAYAFRTQQE